MNLLATQKMRRKCVKLRHEWLGRRRLLNQREANHTNDVISRVMIVKLILLTSFFVALGVSVDTHLGLVTEGGIKISAPAQNLQTSVGHVSNQDIGAITVEPGPLIKKVEVPSSSRRGENLFM